MTESKPKIHAGILLDMIRARYQLTEWAVLDELHDGTGTAAKRRFDAVAFNCWPSSGLIRVGFEIKVSRSDFSKELAAHEKRAALEKHCHEVYFVVGPDVCKAREIPEPWGLLEVRGDRLHCTHKALHRKVGAVAEPLAVCAIRRLSEAMAAQSKRHYIFESDQVTQADIDERVKVGMESGHAEVERLRQAAREEREAARVERTAAERDAAAWWRIWKDLEAAAKGWGSRCFFTAEKCEPPTQAQIADAINRIRLQGAGELEQRLRHAYTSLGAALEALTPVPHPVAAESEAQS